MDVLVVDDDADLRELVTIALEDAGFAVAATGLPTEAAALAFATSPRLVLLDLSMPEFDPAPLVAALRSVRTAPEVVALTGRCDAEQLADALGLDGVLVKPFSTEALVAFVRGRCVDGPAESRSPDTSARL